MRTQQGLTAGQCGAQLPRRALPSACKRLYRSRSVGERFSPRDSLRQRVAAPPAPPAPWDLRLPRWAGGGRGRCGWGGEPGRRCTGSSPRGNTGRASCALASPREGPPLAGRPQMLRLDQEPRKTQRFGLPRISGLGNKLPVRHKSHRQRSSESDRERSRSLKQSSRKSSMECEQESWAERGCA